MYMFVVISYYCSTVTPSSTIWGNIMWIIKCVFAFTYKLIHFYYIVTSHWQKMKITTLCKRWVRGYYEIPIITIRTYTYVCMYVCICKIYQIFLSLFLRTVVISIDIRCCRHISFNCLFKKYLYGIWYFFFPYFFLNFMFCCMYTWYIYIFIFKEFTNTRSS